MKRFFALFLALVMSLSMAVPAFAAEPDDPDEGIELLMQLYEDPNVNTWGTLHTDTFTTTPGHGKYIKVWYRNSADQAATVYLYRDGKPDPVAQVTVNPNSDPGEIWFEVSNTEAGTYYVRIEAQLSGPIIGYLAVAQKTSK